MALTGLETLEVLGQNPTGVPAASTQTTTTGAIAAAGSSGYTVTTVGRGFIQKASATGAGRAGTFTLVGASTVTVTNTTVAITDFIGFSLNTGIGTIGAYPKITSISASAYFTVIGTAADSSTYNYSMIGVN